MSTGQPIYGRVGYYSLFINGKMTDEEVGTQAPLSTLVFPEIMEASEGQKLLGPWFKADVEAF